MIVTMVRWWTNLTAAYIGVLLVRVALFGVGVLLYAKSEASQISRDQEICIFLGVICIFVDVALGLVWLHRAWARVPARHRRAYNGQRVGPDEAIWKLFIPLYGVFYWMFIASTGLCGAVKRQLRRHRARSVGVPSTLGFVACLVQLVPVANVVLSPFLWGMFMLRMDIAQAKAERLDSEVLAPEPIGWLKVAGIVVGAVLAVWVMLVLVFFAIWGFLNPDA